MLSVAEAHSFLMRDERGGSEGEEWWRGTGSIGGRRNYNESIVYENRIYSKTKQMAGKLNERHKGLGSQDNILNLESPLMCLES